MTEAKTFAAQMKNFFGLKPGQVLPGPDGFIAELKALDQKTRDDFTVMLNEAGYPVLPKPETVQPEAEVQS